MTNQVLQKSDGNEVPDNNSTYSTFEYTFGTTSGANAYRLYQKEHYQILTISILIFTVLTAIEQPRKSTSQQNSETKHAGKGQNSPGI